MQQTLSVKCGCVSGENRGRGRNDLHRSVHEFLSLFSTRIVGAVCNSVNPTARSAVEQEVFGMNEVTLTLYGENM